MYKKLNYDINVVMLRYCKITALRKKTKKSMAIISHRFFKILT